MCFKPPVYRQLAVLGTKKNHSPLSVSWVAPSVHTDSLQLTDLFPFYQVVMAVTLTASYWWQEPMPPSCTICTLAPRLACGIHATVYWIGCNMYTHTHMPHTHVYTHELDLVWNIFQNKIPPLIQEEDSCSFIILLDVIRHIVDRQVSVFRKTFCFEIFLKFESKIFTSVSWRKSGNQ